MRSLALSLAVLLLAVSAPARAAGMPFFVFDNGLNGENLKSIPAQLDLVKELGFAGLSWRTDSPARIKEVLDGAKTRGLKLFVIYANLDLKDGKLVHDPRLDEIIPLCKGTDTMIWPNMTSKQFKLSDPEGDEIAVTGLRALADLSAANGLRVALYPHVNMWLHRLEDAVRVVKKVDRANVGLTFNLCHALADGAEDRVPVLIAEAAPHLFVVTVNGADSRPPSKSWEYLIKPLDQGTYDVGIVLAKLRAVGFSGPVGLQCYSIKTEPREHLRGSIAAWRKLSGEDAAAVGAPAALTAEDRAAGWRMLFDGTSLAGWRAYGKPGPIGPGWKAKGGLLHKLAGIPGGDIVTAGSFGDFELSWEWRLAKGANNGVKYFVSDQRPAAPGHEYQMIDDDSERWRDLPGKDKTASFYQVLPPAADKPLRPPGEWNRSRIVVQGDRVEHWLNGRMVLTYVLGSEAVKAGLAASKFNKYPDFGRKIRGPIMLTDHQDEAWFRDIRLREFPAQ
jgi:sugar phosphate isomerase/epimerase